MKPICLQRTPKTRDDLIYTFDAEYKLFQVEKIEDDEREHVCKEFNVTNKIFRRQQTLDFGLVGVFQNHGYKTQIVTVRENEIAGKLVSIGSLKGWHHTTVCVFCPLFFLVFPSTLTLGT